MNTVVAATCRICGAMKLAQEMFIDPLEEYTICNECLKVRTDFRVHDVSYISKPKPKQIYTK